MTKAEVAKEFKKLKKENFKTEAEYEKFLKESDFTQEDVDDRVELQMLSTKIQKQITEGASAPSKSEIEDYYDAALGDPVHASRKPATSASSSTKTKTKVGIGAARPEIGQLAEKLEKSREKILRRRTEQVQRRVPERHRRRRRSKNR